MDERGVLWILQSRPITGELVSGFGLAEGEEDEWLLTYDEPFSPLGCEIAVARYRYWVAAINASFKTRFPAEMQVHDGLLYYRPGWRSAGFPLSVWMNLWRLAAWLGSGRTHRRYVERILPDYLRRLEAIEGAELAELDGPALLGRLHAAVELYLEFQYSSYAIGAAATLSAALLDRACRLLFGPQSPWNALDFLTGLDDVSIQRELEVHRLGRLLQAYLPPGSPPCPDDLAALWQQLDPAGPFWTELQAFLRTYGYLWADRYPRDPAWELNQEALTTSLWTAAQAAPDGDLAARHRQQQARRAQAVAQAAARLTNPFTRWAFGVLLRRAERLFPFKENRNHATYGGMLAIRKVARELGRRLQRRSLLETAEDLFFLELSEIDALWKNPRSASWLARQIEQRKAAYQRSRGRIHQHIPAPHRGEAPDAAAEAIEIRGEPCSPGLARGPARLVSGPGELQRVRPGEIVVCSQLRPAWSAVFARAGGVVIEMGSLLSHGSTLAREYGIPAVINVADITGLVRENDWLVVDGNLGRVAIERRATPNGQGDEQ
ncbi:MAG TPA: PEP-utilizing enzyme, partial [Anaerolineaceae bacterium]|nr:PEP-utilizing enzyme [Anaerolineaceae bacterium]